MRSTVGLSVLVLATSGIGHAVVTDLDDRVRRIDPFRGLSDRPGSGDRKGLNFLVAGVDGREGISEEERRKYRLGGAACDCTDTLLLVHLSADRERVGVVSLPRDTYTKLPAHTDEATGRTHRAEAAKLNSAYAHGGAPLTVNTVERLTKVHVDHYLEVDFASFMRTVDVVGGVPVCTRTPLKDSHSGLDLPKGTSRLHGGEALQYVRARHLDGGSDLGRIQRQQRFLAALVARISDSGTLLNPVKFNRLANTLLGSVKADKDFDSDKMLALAKAMKGFGPASSEFARVPLADTDHRAPGLGSTVRWNEKKAGELFASFREDRPLTDGSSDDAKGRTVEVPPSRVRVEVENATAEQGLGRRADDALRGAGFATTGTPRNAGTDDAARTVISYDPRWDSSARSLAAALPKARLEKEEGRGPTMRVAAGRDFDGVDKVRVRAEPGSDKEGGAVRGDRVGCG